MDRDIIKEVDEHHHLGVLRFVSCSSVSRTLKRCTAARSSFYALNSIGSQFGCIHPLTSFRLYNSILFYMALKYGPFLS